MLLKYIVSNFKSIGHPVEFSMIPTENNNTDARFFTNLHTKYGDYKVLRRGAFFGPNASGKSNFIESIDFAKEYITEARKSGTGTGVPQFKVNIEDLNNTSVFQFIFFVNGCIYEYGFSLTTNCVSEEWLMLFSNDTFIPLFTRVTDENDITEIDIEDEFEQSGSTNRELIELLKLTMKSKQKNLLFLYKLKENGNQTAEEIIDWFENIQVIFPTSKIKWLPRRVKDDENFQKFLSDTLNKLDTGVSEIKVVGGEINFQDFAEKFHFPKDLINDVKNNKSGMLNINGKYFIFFEKDDKTTFLQLKFEHKLLGENAQFDIDDESDGTQRLLDLLPILFINMQKNNNTLFFVDEIDRSLHTKLSKYILQTFLNNSENSFNQIVFTTHDVNLINVKDFSKEEIWFIEKNNSGETSLKPFSDFEISENQNVVKDYLNGRFGAVPVIRGEF